MTIGTLDDMFPEHSRRWKTTDGYLSDGRWALLPAAIPAALKRRLETADWRSVAGPLLVPPLLETQKATPFLSMTLPPDPLGDVECVEVWRLPCGAWRAFDARLVAYLRKHLRGFGLRFTAAVTDGTRQNALVMSNGAMVGALCTVATGDDEDDAIQSALKGASHEHEEDETR